MKSKTTRPEASLQYIKNFAGNDFWRTIPPAKTLSSAKKRARDLFFDLDLGLTHDSIVRACFSNGKSYDFYLTIAGTVACFERK